MSTNRRVLNSSAIAAAEAGEPPPPAIEPAITDALSAAVRAAVVGAEPPGLLSTLHDIDTLVAKSVGQVRRNRHAADFGSLVSDSRLHLAQADTLLALTVTSRAVHGVARSSILNAAAYLDYAQGHYGESLESLATANNVNLELMSLGHPALHCARIQLLHNVARIEIARGCAGLAIGLADAILAHLSGGGTTQFPLSGPWEAVLIDACPAELIACFAYQVAGERAYWRYRLLHSANTGA